MANAGCINAIGFDGTYLRTLDTLDSANIGVGVQYCIPAPLDDKRLDYIKYTDKCGCTCCITGENEILVYATQGVLKNLTLTNDDTNEVVNVKWNDLFGSNRAYTMVRYKTGSYPTSITDGILAVKETTQNQYSVSGYNVSGLTDGTTYYFTAFAVSQDGTIIVVQNKNITTEFTRAGYQKLEYIESNGTTTYIDCGFMPNASPYLKLQFKGMQTANIKTNDYLYGAVGGSTSNNWLSFENTNGFYWNAGATTIFGRHTVNLYTLFEYTITYNNGTLTSSGTHNGTYSYSVGGGLGYTNFCFFRGGTTNSCYMKARCYYLKIRAGTNLPLIRDFYPARRKSDNTLGFLDILHKQFYPNAGSGTFTAGPNIN